MSDACEVFALGPDGHFYLKYRAADDSTKQGVYCFSLFSSTTRIYVDTLL